MAPPVMKRRKLEHTDSEEESEGSFAGFDELNETATDTSAGAPEDDIDDSDVSMSGAEDFQDLEDLEDIEDDSGEEDDEEAHDAEEEHVKPVPAAKATSLPKPAQRTVSNLQDGAYTAESFKSNLFKLQVDELLEQVRLKYGKKGAAAENAMRTLKTIIEQMPSRDALAVRRSNHSTHDELTKYRYPKPRKPSSLPEWPYLSPTLAHPKMQNTSYNSNAQRA
jgi:U3 small nucleolar RNA-associated protein 22